MSCKHPPHRLYAWYAADAAIYKDDGLVVVCLECREILKGAAKSPSEIRIQPQGESLTQSLAGR